MALPRQAVVAPSVTPEAQLIFKKKKNLRILETGGVPTPLERSIMWPFPPLDRCACGCLWMTAHRWSRRRYKSIGNGVLLQTRDNQMATEASFKVVTKRAPSPEEVHSFYSLALCVARRVVDTHM